MNGRTIAKNATVMMVSQLVTWGLTILLTIFLPRYLGAAALGQFHLANSIWAILAIAVTFGMDILLTKEIARDRSKTGQLFGTSVILRLLLYGAALAILALYLRLAGYPADTVAVIYIIGIGNLIWQFIGACQAVLQGLERMEYISLGLIVGKLFNTVASITLLLLGYGVLVIAAVTIGAALVNLIIQLVSMRRLRQEDWAISNLRFDRPTAAWMLRASLPYLMSGIFLVVYMQIDVVIISLLVNEETVGWYGAADHLFGTFLFIPAVFMKAVFPALSRLYTNDPAALPRLMQRSFNLLLLLSVPIGLGLLVLADPIVLLLFGRDFAGSGPVLAIFGLVLILTYQNILLGKFLISIERQNAWTAVMAIATVATLPLDLILIPWCVRAFGNGAMGGAIAFVITEGAMLLAGLWLLPAGSLGRTTASLAGRVLVAGLLMAAVAWWLRDAFLPIPIAAGALVYTAVAFLLHAIPREDLEMALSLAQGALHRVRARRLALAKPSAWGKAHSAVSAPGD
jgi:O-antigen/teichoic acid export membrane protein